MRIDVSAEPSAQEWKTGYSDNTWQQVFLKSGYKTKVTKRYIS